MALDVRFPIVSCWGYGKAASVLGGALALHSVLYPGNERWQVINGGVYDDAATDAALAAHVSGASNAGGLPCAYVAAMPLLSLAQLSVAVGSYGLRVGGGNVLRQMYPGVTSPYAGGEDF